eukprot:5975433-Amphidinium_carterae.1
MRVQDAYIQNANPFECPPLLFREEEEEILGNHSREEESLEQYRPPPLPPPFPEELGQDEQVVVNEEGEEVERYVPLEIIPELPRERQVHFADELVQYDDDPVDTSARGSTEDYRTPRG